MRLLILTDHRGHSESNSLYALVQAFAQLTAYTEIRIASRGTPANTAFFYPTSSTAFAKTSPTDFPAQDQTLGSRALARYSKLPTASAKTQDELLDSAKTQDELLASAETQDELLASAKTQDGLLASAKTQDELLASAKTQASPPAFAKTQLLALPADAGFERKRAAQIFEAQAPGLLRTPLDWPDVVFLRIPHPVPPHWFDALRAGFGDKPIYNQPEGIAATASKAWLLNVPQLCAPMQLCPNPQSLLAWAYANNRQIPRDLVLKPLEGYGGRGIIRVLAGQVDLPEGPLPLAQWPQHPLAQQPYLAMDYLPAVHEGDKRIVVIDGQVVGAILRIPPQGQWLCNIAQGGRAEPTDIAESEHEILQQLDPHMRRLGIVMYGVDTLVGHDGRRVLSEVNTMSVGGLLDLPSIFGRSAAEYAAELLTAVFERRPS